MSTNSVFHTGSTYRIQFNSEFNFKKFRKIIPYLAALGIKTIYASPIFEASPGSTHGYDGTDPNKINPEIGTLEELLEISQELKDKGIGWVQDIVPNHLSYHENNKWLMDVLQKGEASPHARVFDIVWDHPDYPGKLMVPFPGSELETFLKKEFPGEDHYVLCSWQETDYRMNYRRFFLVNTLICTNIHFDDVFEKYHQLVKQLVEKEVFQGLRVDHVDGLYDPGKYLKDLRTLAGEKSYLIVEKILEAGEQMPHEWPIEGNSGYDFLGILNNVFTDRSAEYDLTAYYYDISKDGTPVEQLIHDKKEMILTKYMRGELDNLVRLYKQVAGTGNVELSDEDLRHHIASYLVNCPVYRYYDDIPLMDIDSKAGRSSAQMKAFYQRCMQFTGPLMAKGVEDTLMYTYNRFIGQNEVGDSPDFFGYTVQDFHSLMEYRNRHWPLAMNATSTHDTKRGEDVRARLNVLTALHTEWLDIVRQWEDEYASKNTGDAPDQNDRYFIYQTLVGSYPVFSPQGVDKIDSESYPVRIKEYLEKSLREAKVHSTWTEQNKAYEEGTIAFAHSLIDKNQPFLNSFYPFLRKVIDFGMINSLAQLILKCTCPGIPDIYQGTEVWDLSLVDPDNRRPVDYNLRQKMLNDDRSLTELWNTRWTGAVKMKLLRQLLELRNTRSELFAKGSYEPLTVDGTHGNSVIAFQRKHENNTVIVAAALHFAKVKEHTENNLLAADWKDTMLNGFDERSEKWRNVLTGEEFSVSRSLPLSDLFKSMPFAVLVQ